MFAITTGRRCSALLIIAAVFCLYGVGLIVGYVPTFASALHLHLPTIGGVLVGAGLFTATGVFVRNDRWHFTVAATVMGAWALILATHWTQGHGWVASISWLGLCALTMLISSWPENPLRLTAMFRAETHHTDSRITRLEHALKEAGIHLPESKDSHHG